jgi:WXG100 family type VII secretion target
MTQPTGGQILYNFNTMSEAVLAIDTAISKMRGTLDEIEQGMRPLETGAWESEAQVAYRLRKDRWNNAANHIALVLGQVKLAVANSSERMQATDRRAAGYFPS